MSDNYRSRTERNHVKNQTKETNNKEENQRKKVPFSRDFL